MSSFINTVRLFQILAVTEFQITVFSQLSHVSYLITNIFLQLQAVKTDEQMAEPHGYKCPLECYSKL